MTTTVGAGQTSLVLSSNASASAQTYYFTKFVSRPLIAQTISANTWTYKFGAQESNANANFPTTTTGTVQICLYVWRPSNGTKVGNVLIGNSVTGFAEASTSESAISGTFSGSSVSAANGDVLIMEIIFTTTQGNATARTDTFYYDGTTTDSTSSNAAQISTPQNLLFGFAASLTETITVSEHLARTKTPITPVTVYGTISQSNGFYQFVDPTVTKYLYIAGGNFAISTESYTQMTYRTAGTASYFSVLIGLNTLTGSSTARLRKNAADSNQSVSIPAGTTGWFRDVSHTDTISAGDKLNGKIVAGTGSDTIRVDVTSFLYDVGSSAKAVTRMGFNNSGYSYQGSFTYYLPPMADNFTFTSITDESIAKFRIRKAGTIRNLAINSHFNSGTTTSTCTSRKNGADGNLTVSIAGAATGFFEDTTHFDSVSAGDDYNYKFIAPTSSTESVVIDAAAADYQHSTLEMAVMCAKMIDATSLNFGSTIYSPLSGQFYPFTSADGAPDMLTTILTVGKATFSELTTNIPTNSINGTTTLTLVADDTDTALTVSISSSSTGVFSDSTHSVDLYDTAFLYYRLDAAGSSGSLTTNYVSSWYEIYRPSAVVAPLYLQPVFMQWIDS
jgi:hypothetical protein